MGVRVGDWGSWWPARDGDVDALRLYARHYSCRRMRNRKLLVAPGEKKVLVTADGLALFVWRKFIDDCALGGGVNCAVFRNDGPRRGSELILESVALSRGWGPGERLYTYVDPKRVASRNPGWCFICAGWRRCGVSVGGLLVLELV